MKTEKKTTRLARTGLSLVAILSLFAAVQFQAHAQTGKETHHAKLSEHHVKAMEKAAALKEGTVTAKADQAKHSKEIGEHLTEAKKHHAALEKATPEHKPHHAAIKKHHAEAALHHKALAQETAKAKPDAAKVKEHATKVHAAVEKAENEHKALKEKSNR